MAETDKGVLPELLTVIGVMNEVRLLMLAEHAALRERYGQPAAGDMAAGGPAQTLLGAHELLTASRETVRALAEAIGYTTAGVDDLGARAVSQARRALIAFPSGANRMARPLGGRVHRAFGMVRGVSAFFTGDVGTEIEVVLAAPEATWPPDDWDAYRRSRCDRTGP